MDGNKYLLSVVQVWMWWARCLEEATKAKTALDIMENDL